MNSRKAVPNLVSVHIVYLENKKKYCGAGKEIQIDTLNAYINGREDAESAVVVNHDLFGWKSPNVRAIVDKVASDGHLVIVGDLFRGKLWEHGTDFSPANLGAFFAMNPDDRVQGDIAKLCTYFQKQKKYHANWSFGLLLGWTSIIQFFCEWYGESCGFVPWWGCERGQMQRCEMPHFLDPRQFGYLSNIGPVGEHKEEFGRTEKGV